MSVGVNKEISARQRVGIATLLPCLLLCVCSGWSQEEAASAGPAGVAVPGPIRTTITEWETPTPNEMPHDPFVSKDGSIWYTANKADKLGRFDPKSGQFKEYPLKTPKSGPHSLIADTEGTIWFTVQSANYIGKLDPKTGEITEYPFPDPAIKGANNLLFDKHGTLLFVSASSGMIGRMNTKSGSIKMARIPGAQPRGIALNSKGVPFFSESSNNKLASFDPDTLEIKEYALPKPDVRVRRIAIDSDDVIWGSDIGRGYLVRFDPNTGKFGEWPSPSGPKSEPYAITAEAGAVWYNESHASPSTIVRFDPKSEKFQSWLIPSGGGAVHHMLPDPKGNIWIACSGTNRIAKVELKK